MEDVDAEVVAGQAVYNRFVLSVYDLWVLRMSCRYLWRCPNPVMLANYQRNVGARHLDLGVGTGFFLDRVSFPQDGSDVTLLDLNETSLRTAAQRIHRYRPATVRADVLQPFPPEAAGPYDSIGLNFLLHCLPGTWPEKGKVFEHAAPLRAAGGKVFGSTILGTGVPIGAAARRLMATYNRRGIFHNTGDDLEGLKEQLGQHFPAYQVVVQGCVAVFAAGDEEDFADA